MPLIGIFSVFIDHMQPHKWDMQKYSVHINFRTLIFVFKVLTLKMFSNTKLSSQKSKNFPTYCIVSTCVGVE